MNDHKPYLVPVSAKGIVIDEGRVWLRKNERNEWELPGGKLDEGEQPEETLARELREELGFDVSVERLMQVHLYNIQKSIDESRGVFVVTFLCKLLEKSGTFELEGEAGKAEFRAFLPEELNELNMPLFYKESILGATHTLV